MIPRHLEDKVLEACQLHKQYEAREPVRLKRNRLVQSLVDTDGVPEIEIAEMFDVSRERIRQIVNEVRRELTGKPAPTKKRKQRAPMVKAPKPKKKPVRQSLRR